MILAQLRGGTHVGTPDAVRNIRLVILRGTRVPTFCPSLTG